MYLCAMVNEMRQPDYELFDRQLTVFCNTVETLVVGWHEYCGMELSMDLNSLCMKGARLCYIADEDAVWQKEDLTQMRLADNRRWKVVLQDLLRNHLAPMIIEVVDNFRSGVPFSGVDMPSFKGEFSDFLTYLQKSLSEDGAEEKTEQVIFDIQALHEITCDRVKRKPEGETDLERFWSLVQLYALACYLYYHFHKLSKEDYLPIDDAEAERLLVRAIQDYSNSEEGSYALRTFMARLMFENDDRQLSREQLLSAGKRLVNDIPEVLQYCYIAHRGDTRRMASELLAVHPTADDLRCFVAVIAKWQMLHEQIFRIDHPSVQPVQEDTIFNTVLNGRTVDMKELKSAIGEMVKLVKRKNQWFCVWCVLKHRNLLADTHFQAFADQMMRPDWFGGEAMLRFSGENISDYSSYLGQTDFTLWNLKDFRDYRELHGKSDKKLSDKLFVCFQHLCFEMDTFMSR